MPIDWFLTEEERCNPASPSPAWFAGSDVWVHVHGASYVDRLVECVDAMLGGDHLLFTDWRGDPRRTAAPGRADGRTAAVGRVAPRRAGPRPGVAFPP